MFRRSIVRRLLNVSGESPSFRSKPGLRNLQLEVQDSPYKEQFKDFWATPVPFADREFGRKPKLGEPVPTRRAASTLIVGKNKYADPEAVASGADNDYKVLMMFRESKGRMIKDQFVLPSNPVTLEDSSADWDRLLQRHGLVTNYPDLHHRLTAMRSLLSSFNLLLIPKTGGGIAEVEGPPGPRRWFMIIYQQPKAMRHLVDVLDLPMEDTLSQLIPFRRVLTPETETFRFDNLSYIVPTEKIFDVSLTISTQNERLVWVSPMEAMARFNAGIMNMPTANLILLSELANECPTFADISKRNNHSVPRVVQPELFRHNQTKVATVVLPGDLAHSETTEEDRKLKFVRRFVYEKDYPHGFRSVFAERPASEEEISENLVKEKPALLEEANANDMLYAEVPYPERKHSLHTESKTMYPVPEHKLRDGRENSEGYVPVKRNLMNMDLKEEDITFADILSSKKDEEFLRNLNSGNSEAAQKKPKLNVKGTDMFSKE